MRTLTFSLLTLLTFAACDSSSDPAAAAGELATANAKIGAAVAAGLAASSQPPCPGGGSVEVVESGDGYRMTFTDCSDVSGTFDVQTLSAGTTGASLRFDGDLQVRNSCDVSYDAFEAATTFEGGTSTLTYDGRIDATCPSGGTTCTFNNTSFTISQSGAPPDLSPYCS